MKIRLIFSLQIVFALTSFTLLGQTPDWAVEPTAYNNSMVITAVLNINTIESRDTADIVAAFIGNEVRGVAKPVTYLESKDRYVAQIIIYSNEVNEEITFRLYCKNDDVISSSVISPIVFQADGILGSFSDPVIIKDNNQPTDLALTDSVVQENQPEGLFVGKFSTVDDDATDTFTYELLAGEGDKDNSLFDINNDTLYVLQTFNFETDTAYSIRVKSTDSKGGSIEKAFQIYVDNINDLPTDIFISNQQIAENNEVGEFVAILSTDDQDVADIHTYTLVDGVVENSLFEISGDSLFAAQSLNFETKSSYTIKIQTDDGRGGTFTKEFTIQVLDANDKPEIKDRTFSINENTSSGTEIGTFTSFDQDPGTEFTYSIIEISADSGAFALSTDGILTVDNNALLDYEVTTDYTLLVEVSDNGNPALTDTALVTINIIDIIEKEFAYNNVITPNGDGYNDVLFIHNLDLYEEYTLSIFDSRGIEVYSTSDYDNSWGGSDLQAGTYYLHFSASNTPFVYKEILTIIK
ncbi:MAG: hypothetical protein CMO01_12680 [Thalassobius sp.]|nr:hypothetical protein [Thalassovita sp.]